jgi:DNA-binding transcriptional LysR family regulator
MNLNRLAYFAAVVDAGSFTRAADRLGITKAVVSQQVARLEEEVGASLLVRTTRRVEPTEAGRMFHARCVLILREAEDAFAELAQTTGEPKGMLRVTAPSDYGSIIVAPLAAEFTLRHPACQVELMVTDVRLDLLQNQIDLSIRVGWLEESALQARRIGAFRQVLVGSASFAQRAAAIADPDELIAWPFIANAALKEPLSWRFSRGDMEQRMVRLQASMSADATPAVLAATRAGGGLSIVPDFSIGEDLATGRLIQILPDWSLPAGGIHAVYPAARFRPAKVTAFVAMLAEEERQRAARPHPR